MRKIKWLLLFWFYSVCLLSQSKKQIAGKEIIESHQVKKALIYKMLRKPEKMDDSTAASYTIKQLSAEDIDAILECWNKSVERCDRKFKTKYIVVFFLINGDKKELDIGKSGIKIYRYSFKLFDRKIINHIWNNSE
ncbi:MAG: hypothetical protein QM534_15565 [Sediminibacterium sp.]|nr:hypothetical protein [Sediminibacterium sp.]